jgi:hypothetical protein
MTAVCNLGSARLPFKRISLRHFFAILASRTQRQYALTWVRSWKRNYLLDRPYPWLTFDAVRYLEAHWPTNARVFEYGSGGSTLYWLRRSASCVSIEHDPIWYDELRSRLANETHIDYRLVLPEASNGGVPGDPADPEADATADADLRNLTFHQYVAQIDSFADEFFDIVLIDGRSRPACIRHSVDKVHVRGLLILDNADRDYYLERSRSWLKDFAGRSFVGVLAASDSMGRTDIYERVR